MTHPFGLPVPPEQFVEKCFTLGEHFLNCYENENKRNRAAVVNFYATSVIKHNCRTIACHGGWGCLLPHDARPNMTNYLDGAHRIAQHLGFSDRHPLESWALQYPHLWGNDCGHYMFTGEGYVAFGATKDEQVDLLSISQWWVRVGQRVLLKIK